MTEIFEHGYALLVGVGKSAYPKLSLPVTVKDTQSLLAALIDSELCSYLDSEEHIQILNNEKATRDGILDGLKWLKEKADADPAATVLVYYSGHGWLEDSEQGYYLLQHDIEPFDIAGSALSADDFTTALRQIQSERLLVILDCCHAAGMANSKEGKADNFKLPPGFSESSASVSKGFIDSLKEGKGRVVFTSCRGEQQSWIKDENSSVYTYHLLEALQGAGNAPGDTEVRVSNLMQHLSKAVPESARSMYDAKQTPWFDMDTEDFAIAKIRGGKGLPDKGWGATKSEATQKISQIAQTVNAKFFTVIEKAENLHIGDTYNR